MADEESNVTDIGDRRGPDPYTGHQKRGNPKGRITRAALTHDAITMLLSGRTEQAIADALSQKYRQKITANRVSKLLNGQLERWASEDRASIENVRELQLRRIDRLEQALWGAAIGVRDDGTRREPSIRAIGEVRKLEALRARIAGTEAPKRVELAGELNVAFSPEDFERLDQAWANSGGEIVDAEVVGLPEASSGA